MKVRTIDFEDKGSRLRFGLTHSQVSLCERVGHLKLNCER